MRKKIIGFVFSAMLSALCFSAEAQQPVKVPRVGLLLQRTSTSLITRLEGFQQGLRERGYVEGKNIAVEQRFDDDDETRLTALAADLVRLRVDVIVAAATPAVKVAKQATATFRSLSSTVRIPLRSDLSPASPDLAVTSPD
jgi:putative ABC transport system substrate-binding protein